jgi:hypothetical protein
LRYVPEISALHAVARRIIADAGDDAFVILVVDQTWAGVVPRRGDQTWEPARRDVHARLVRARTEAIVDFAATVWPPSPDPAALVRGCDLNIPADAGDLPPAEPNLRLVEWTLEHRAKFLARELRSPRGLQLRRWQADQIAAILEALALRSERPVRCDRRRDVKRGDRTA